MSELLLLRHAEPESAGLYLGRGSDPPLSPRGLKEAERIAEILSSREDAPELIYTSPQKRAVETVEPLAKCLHRRIHRDEGLMEIDFGEWDGLSWKEIRTDDFEHWKAWLENPWTVAPPGGETLEDLQDRVICSIEGLLKKHHGKRILVAGHGGSIRTVLGYALSLDPVAYWSVAIDYGSLCRFRHVGTSGLELLQWNVPLKKEEDSQDF